MYLFLEYCSGGALFDRIDHLKLADFGLATRFRFKGQERLLSRLCGTCFQSFSVEKSIKLSLQMSGLWKGDRCHAGWR
ncbi:hypothetical protein Q5P01_000654 [Channa striata]|uniref:Protein kinase domain-containing protein n=1 Tax=Channa striata TaxID=64152 RepID=A0AA88IKW7_CHASR|nr:hypothetical protein Q5P01_000654 [Channa striata]